MTTEYNEKKSLRTKGTFNHFMNKQKIKLNLMKVNKLESNKMNKNHNSNTISLFSNEKIKGLIIKNRMI